MCNSEGLSCGHVIISSDTAYHNNL
uniref:Uncharacterized protein n=1 Tax=Anopheles albimanus TaxID=7167 RepID=A0A182FWU3_ANOAL